MQYDKASLRSTINRFGQHSARRTLESIAIANQCLGLPLWDQHNYHIFKQSENAEVNTEPLLTVLQGKEKTVVVPKLRLRSNCSITF